MKKLFILISIIAACFCFTPVFAAAPEAPDAKKIVEDLKEDRKRAAEAISQDEQKLREFMEHAKEESSAAKGSVEEGKNFRMEPVNMPPAEENKVSETNPSQPVQRGLYLLIALCLGVIYYYRILIYKKKLAAEEKINLAKLDENLLAAVNQWRFMEEDFKKYQDKFTPLVDAQALDINSPEFKKHFVKDLAITEVLFQAALNEKIDLDPAVSVSLGQYKLYLSTLEESSAFSGALDKYKLSLFPAAGQQVPYVVYYKDFLDLLILINKQDDAAVFELYERYLFINKLASNAGRGSADPGEIQEALDSVINKFKSEYNVIIKEEGIEPPEDMDKKNVDKP